MYHWCRMAVHIEPKWGCGSDHGCRGTAWWLFRTHYRILYHRQIVFISEKTLMGQHLSGRLEHITVLFFFSWIFKELVMVYNRGWLGYISDSVGVAGGVFCVILFLPRHADPGGVAHSGQAPP